MFTVCKDKVSPWGRVKKKVKNFLFPAEKCFPQILFVLGFLSNLAPADCADCRRLFFVLGFLCLVFCPQYLAPADCADCRRCFLPLVVCAGLFVVDF